MAQGFTQDEVHGILENIDGSDLVDGKTKLIQARQHRIVFEDHPSLETSK